MGAVYYPDEVPGIAPGAAYALGLLSALLLASILLHELGHSVVARRAGGDAGDRPRLRRRRHRTSRLDSRRAAGGVEYQLFVNTAILVFNLLPAFPLDGGRVTRSLIWGRRGDLSRATTTAAAIGRGFGYAMIGLGVLGAAASPEGRGGRAAGSHCLRRA